MKNMKIDEKLLKTMGMVAGGFVIFIIIFALVVSCTKKGAKYTIDNLGKLEQKLIALAKDYYNEHPDSLPSEGSSINLSIQTLVNENRLAPLEELVVGLVCTGQITVSNNNGYHLYLPKLDCGNDYTPKNLSQTLIDEKNIVSSGNGLYEMNNKYVYRGETVNNHLSFAGKNWAILSINKDGSMRIMDLTRRESTVWDDHYNIDRNTNSGINNYVQNNLNSRIKDQLLAIYNNEEEFTANDKAHFLKHDLCVGKRSEDDIINDGSIECASVIKDEIFGLIQVNEFINASLDPACQSAISLSCINYNYLAKIAPSYWTITADKNTSHKAYKISDSMNLVNATSTATVRIVALLSSEVLYSSGDGSIDNPYQLISSPA